MKRTIKNLENITDLDQIETYNEETERIMCEAFLKSPVAKLYEREFEYVLGLIAARIKALKAGEEPFPIRQYDADTLNRLLSADTFVTYPVAEYSAEENSIINSITGKTSTFATSQQISLINSAGGLSLPICGVCPFNSATHFKESGVTNGLNGLREKNILMWNKGGRKAKSGGRALANEYFFNFPKLSTQESSDKPSSPTIRHDATYAYATTQPPS